MLTYSLLGDNGALGNQLWQIAGTLGSAGRFETVVFPSWFYEPYFKLRGVEFSEYWTTNHRDLAPDYLQDINRWWRIRDYIWEIFEPTELVTNHIARVYDDWVDPTKCTAVHVRRANNLKLPNHHPVPTLEYFEEALDCLGQWGGERVMVFSDDMAWCRKQDCFKDAVFTEGIPNHIDKMQLTKYAPLPLAEAAYDLHTMSMCERHIISNSTFSWWGAFLGRGRMVFYPKEWYGPALAHINTQVMFDHLHWASI